MRWKGRFNCALECLRSRSPLPGYAAAALLLFAAAACGPEPETTAKPTRPEPAWADLLREVRGLTARHRVAEALERLRANAGAFSDLHGPEERALREEEGRLLTVLARPAEAAALLTTLEARDGPAERSGILLVRALLDEGKADAALARLEALPRRAQAELRLDKARALLATGDKQSAVRETAALLIDDPWESDAYLVLGQALAECGRMDGAKAFLERFRDGEEFRDAEQRALRHEYDGEDARALLVRARIERGRGRWFEAMELLNRARRIEPALGPAWLELADIALRLARPGDAIRALEALPPEPEFLVVLARAYEEAGESARAQETCKKALAQAEEAAKPALAAEARDTFSRLEAPAAPSDFDLERQAIVRRMHGRPLSSSLDDILALADLHAEAGDIASARGLALLAVRLSPSANAPRERVVRYYDRDADMFVRIWARRGIETPGARRANESELERLGLGPEVLAASAKTTEPPRR